MFAKKKLTKAEQKHLRENKVDTLDKFRRQIEFQQQEYKKMHEGKPHVLCWNCISIAKKLDMWGDQEE